MLRQPGMQRRGSRRSARNGRNGRNRRMDARADASSIVTRLGSLVAAWRVVLVLLAVVLVVFGARALWHKAQASSRFQVKTIDIQGLERAQRAEILAEGEILAGMSILDIDLDGTAQAIQKHPWVAEASVRRRLPDHLEINVREYQASMIVDLGELYLASGDGELFKRLAPHDGVALPLLSGLEREFIDLYPKLSAQVIQDAIALLAATEDAGIGRLEQLRWHEVLAWSAVMTLPGGNPVMLHLGDSPMEGLRRATAVLERLREVQRVPREIWLDGKPGGKNGSYRIQVRPLATKSLEEQNTIIAKVGE